MRPGIRNSKAAPRSSGLPAAIAALAAWSALALWFFYASGWILYYGDAEAHLNIARRIVDAANPGISQFGSPWLPVPHALMLPLVGNEWLWRSGLAGAIASAFCFVVAGGFLFAAVRRVFQSTAAAATATALFALNPNVMYLSSSPMTEPAFFACLMALLYFTVRFRETQGWGAVIGAGVAAFAGTLTRYDGWFPLPFVALYFLLSAERRRFLTAAVFSAIAALGPLCWLAYNWYLTADPLWFYRGPYSALAIQRGLPYPGKGSWPLSFLYVRSAAELCAGPGLTLVAIAGLVVAFWKRAFWPVILLALPAVFYIWSMHSSGTPIFMPGLPWPASYYNTRYGLSALPLLVFAGGALVAIAKGRARVWIAAVAIAAACAPWLLHPSPEPWVTWKESEVNSFGRREWTRLAAAYLAPRYKPGSGIISTFGDITGVYREAGIPLRETFTECNGLMFDATVERPDLYLKQEWAVVQGGDRVQTAINRAGLHGIHYALVQTIIVKDAPVIEIYRRIGGFRGIS